MLNGFHPEAQTAESSKAVQASPENPANVPVPEGRRPFLVDPKAVTIGLPFTPAQVPMAGPIKASPGILNINVESATADDPEKKPAPARPILPTKTQRMVESPFQMGQLHPAAGHQTQQAGPTSSELASTANSHTGIGPGAMPQIQSNPGAGPVEVASQGQQAAIQPDPANLAQTSSAETFTNTRHETRPSQPVSAIYPDPNMGMGMAQSNQTPYYPMPPYPLANQANMTPGMPAGTYMPPPAGSFPLPGYANPTLGMPMPNNQPPYPLELGPALHSNNTIGMTPYEQQQLSQMLAFHSNATMMMPTMTEAEARARLLGNPIIPTVNAAAMVLQNSANGRGLGNGQANYGSYSAPMDETEEEDQEGGEMNILAVIIFGTLSVTALGGFGMLILLVFTSPMS
jgi:hypothetical protein